MEKEIKITPPEGFEIDRENSTFECVKFKPIEKKRWRNNKEATVCGYFVDNYSNIVSHTGFNNESNYNIFNTKKQAKSALAMARISQIMANDVRFGGVVTDKEWGNESLIKYIICKNCRKYSISSEHAYYTYHFLAFHREQQRDLFLEENEDLVKDYLMVE